MRAPSLRRSLLLAVAVALTAGALPAQGQAASALDRDVLKAVRGAGFDQIIDSEAPGSGVPGDWYRPAPAAPQVDVSVIDLNAVNRPRQATTVILDRDHPRGFVVPVGRDLSSRGVRYRKWDQDRYDGTNGKAWDDPYAQGEDVAPGRTHAAVEFLLPYPASVLKTMVAFGVMREVDAGRISLDDSYTYDPSPANCYGGGTTRTVREFMTLMITQSDNESTCALLVRLHQLDALDRLNAWFGSHGLESLSLRNTRATDGGGWSAGRGVFMGSLDTAKLMWLVDGANGVLWRDDDNGKQITRRVLSARSRGFLKDLYANQGFNEVLATTNWCGATLGPAFGADADRLFPAPGIPTATPARFILPDGTVEVEGVPYGQQVGPCNAAAEVVFSHKTGLVLNSGADVGYVHSLPGKRRRDYAVAVFTNLGNRYGDAIMNASQTDPRVYDCWTELVNCYSESFARLGSAIDTALARRP